MNEYAGLPAEVERFLAQRRSIALLVRGGPGTGRSLLARAIVERQPGPTLLLTDETGAEPPPGARCLVADIPTLAADPARFSPLGTLRRAGVPGSDAIARCPTLVVDSWDSFADHFLGRGGRRGGVGPETERGLFERIARECDRLIAIVGLGRTTALEYLVDGIVETVQTHVDERAERWVRMIKLRGVEMAQSNYPFTLSGGRFRAFPPFPADGVFGYGVSDPDPGPGERTVWPGAADFAAAFGRLPIGAITLVEVDPGIPAGIQLAVALPVFVHGALQEGRVAFVPPPTLFPPEIWNGIRGSVPASELPGVVALFRERVRLLSHAAPDAEDPEFGPCVIPLRGFGRDAPLMTAGSDADATGFENVAPRFPELSKFLTTPAGDRRNIGVIFLDGLTAAAREIGSGYTPDSLATVLEHDVTGRRSHFTVVARADDPLTRGLYGLAEGHVRLLAKQGRYFLRGTHPWTSNFVLVPPAGGAKGPSPYHLLRVA